MIDFEPAGTRDDFAGDRRSRHLAGDAQSLSISMSPNSFVEHLELRRRDLQVHRADASLHDSQLADRDKAVCIVVAQLEAIHEYPIALEQQARDGVGVGHARRDDAEAAVRRFDEAFNRGASSVPLTRTSALNWPARFVTCVVAGCSSAMSMGVLFDGEIELCGPRGRTGPVRDGNSADSRQHGGRALLETGVEVDRAPRVMRFAGERVELHPFDRPLRHGEIGVDDRVVARALNHRARIEDAGERTVSEEKLVDVLHLDVVELERQIVREIGR